MGLVLPWWLTLSAIAAHRLHLKILGSCALSKLTKASQGLGHDMDYLQQLSMRLFKKLLPKKYVKLTDRLIVSASLLVVFLAQFGLGWLVISIATTAFACYGSLLAYRMLKQSSDSCELGSCNVVKQSRFSKFFGIRVELLGILYFLALIAFQLILALNNFEPELLQNLVFALISLGITTSAVFIFLQVKVIRSFCASCMNVHGVSLSVFMIQAVHFAF